MCLSVLLVLTFWGTCQFSFIVPKSEVILATNIVYFSPNKVITGQDMGGEGWHWAFSGTWSRRSLFFSWLCSALTTLMLAHRRPLCEPEAATPSSAPYCPTSPSFSRGVPRLVACAWQHHHLRWLSISLAQGRWIVLPGRRGFVPPGLSWSFRHNCYCFAGPLSQG